MVEADTVLIIDDEPDSCLLWKAFLSQMRFKVFTALTLEEGLRLAESVKPGVIFLDNNLPDGLGWEHVNEFRSLLPGCKINLISAYQFDHSKWIGQNVRVFEKPITLSNIKALLG
jgi:two-component system OmpR family response regulator